MNENIYLLYRIAAIPRYKNSDAIDRIVKTTGVPHRSVKALVKILNNEYGLTKNDIDTICDAKFYTMENMVRAAKAKWYDLIPEKFFEDEEFLNATGIDFIPDDMASGNKELETFHICKQIKRIGDGAFDGCANLKHITFDDGNLEVIGENAFRGAKKLRLEEIPETVKHIGNGAFEKCAAITKFKIPDGVTQIGERTFYLCMAMKEVSFNWLAIGKNAFRDCINLRNLNGHIRGIEYGAFNDCISLEGISLDVDRVPADAFTDCDKLKKIHFNRIPKVFEEGCFKRTTNLERVTANGFMYQLREAEGFAELTNSINFQAGILPRDIFQYNSSVHAFLANA